MHSRTELLGLPLELRLMIFDWVIRLPNKPPTAPELEAQYRRRERRKMPFEPNQGEIDVSQLVYFPTRESQNPALPLLLTSRQIYIETESVLPGVLGKPSPATHPGNGARPTRIKSASASGYEHVLDVVLRSDCTLWPTWTAVPFQRTTIDKLVIRVRLLDAKNEADPRAAGLLAETDCHCGAEWCYHPAPLAKAFHHMLRWLLICGFKWVKPNPVRHGNWTSYSIISAPLWARRVIWDFVPATSPSGQPLACPKSHRLLRKAAWSSGLPLTWSPQLDAFADADLLMHSVHTWFRDWVRLGGMDQIEHGKIFYDHFGRTEMWAGSVCKVLDTRRYLREAQRWMNGEQYDGSRHTRSDFKVWRENMVDGRREFHLLPIEEPVDGETWIAAAEAQLKLDKREKLGRWRNKNARRRRQSI